ncbi:hypothetical protein FVE85_3376 [Porphyridium purpureum]|uniref:Uncharacterized protein n=1 Tax=Porphyridium purpureum TaxID=35688 RepID=A0A5J4YV48_PORPP|nr:hypothetical protein FVE85_3376 [Porphyridium purpureum]|eukprot:POR6034..scf227_4
MRNGALRCVLSGHTAEHRRACTQVQVQVQVQPGEQLAAFLARSCDVVQLPTLDAANLARCSGRSIQFKGMLKPSLLRGD